MAGMEGVCVGKAVTGGPRLLLRLEGVSLFVAALAGFALTREPWWLFAALILVPDLSMLGYLLGNRAGAAIYNAMHVTIIPLALGLAGLALAHGTLTALAAIWLAHIGIDRALGYGLKYSDGFGITHLGPIGRRSDHP